ncbi:MAG: SpoIID/LytB domain-containing protein [Massilibacteroides sp.]|nr:SpoIID/LytB domain-containing protein [Massilibacteroides sp.]
MGNTIRVGILERETITFCLNGGYKVDGVLAEGEWTACTRDGRVEWNGRLYDELVFEPVDQAASFWIRAVVIGLHFHWERKEDQQFQGALRLIVNGRKLVAINRLPVEDYLTSVISSEMSAAASLELLKAHAVISRSWLLAQIGKNKGLTVSDKKYTTFTETEEERVRWYDREDHTLFDVCADDHCQRYQGITRAASNLAVVRRAVQETCGQVLFADGQLCDARFSKCCGGVVEEFQNCWEDKRYSYLVKLRDLPGRPPVPNLMREAESVRWIESRPDAFCNTTDQTILLQVLNNYDQETTDFYRWKVRYTQEELSELVCRRSEIDFGTVQDLIPVARGTSGRLTRLRIVGTKRTMVIGKELEIRRTLSASHLYSSAFVVWRDGTDFILKGAGWGHGVGLCQIGAAVMGEKGYAYDEILLHYYPGAVIKVVY